MSGISGEISFNCNLRNRDEEFISMQKALNHRGPDLHGEYFSTNAVLLSNQLVTEKNTIQQPFTYVSNEAEFTILLDGLLFNCDEIISKLNSVNIKTDTTDSAEIILKAFIAFGKSCVNMFNGVFAFAIWNGRKKELFFARDRFSIKPFFYSLINNNFIFASEIKALFENDEIHPQIDFNSIVEVMFTGPGKTPGYAVFNDICELAPATYGTFSQSGLIVEKYWFLKAVEHNDSFEQTVEKVRYLVTDSIKRQIVSDSPISTMLSGGLDSSIVSAVADKFFNEKDITMDTFTVTYTDNDKYFKETKFQPNSDSQFVSKINDKLHARNHLIEIDTMELANAIYSAVEARDLPGMADIDSSLLLFCSEIRNYTKISVSGECSDEIFGGYPWYRDKTMLENKGFPWAQSTEYRKSFLNDELLKSVDAESYLYSKYIDTVKSAHIIDGTGEDDVRTQQMMRLNIDWFMQTLVDRCDRMSAYCSLDVRVPFCDYRIVEYLYSTPWKFRDYKNYEKGLLREAFKDILPDEILWRKKSPYPKTHNPAYLSAVSDEMKKLLENSNAPIFNFVKKQSLKKLLNDNISQPFYGQLMTTPQTIAYFLQVNYWLEKYNIKINL